MGEKLTSLAKRLRPFIAGQIGQQALSGAFLQEGPGIDLVGNVIGLGGDTILLYKSDGSPIAEYPATEAGIDSAFAAAVEGNIIAFPKNIVIAVTAGKTIPVGVVTTGPNLLFSGFAGVAIAMSTGADLGNFNIAYNGAGQASAMGVYANAVQCNVSNGRVVVYDATTNIGLDLKGNNTGGLRINAQNLTGECYGGTTNHCIVIRDHVTARDIYGEVHDNNAVAIRTEIASLAVDDWIMNGWGNAPSGTTAYGVQVASGSARLIGVNCTGSTSGLRIESGATAYVYGCRASAISNAGTILGETFVDSTSLYIDDEAQFYGEAGGNVTLRSIDNNSYTKLLISPKGQPAGGDTSIHLYQSRTGEGAADELFLGIGASHGVPEYLFLTGDATNHGNMIDVIFGSEDGVTRYDAMRLDAAGFMAFLTYFDIEEIAAPAAPPVDTARIYARDDAGTTKLYYKRSDGTEIEIGAGGVLTDELVAVSANDTTPGYLNGKLIQGTYTTLTENNDGGDETLTVDVDMPVEGLNNVDTAGKVDGAAFVWDEGNSEWRDSILIRDDGSSAQIGNTSDYLNVDGNGSITLVGDARVRKEIRIEAVIAGKGVSAPTDTTRAVGSSGNVKVPVTQFSKVSQNDVYFEMHMPHDLDASADATFHLMWFPGASWTTGNYLWKLEYIITAESGVELNANAPTTISADITPTAATNVIETEFATAISGLQSDYLLWCHFYRDVAGDNGDDVGDVRWFEIEYVSNSLGEQYSTPPNLLIDENGDYLTDENGDRLTD